MYLPQLLISDILFSFFLLYSRNRMERIRLFTVSRIAHPFPQTVGNNIAFVYTYLKYYKYLTSVQGYLHMYMHIFCSLLTVVFIFSTTNNQAVFVKTTKLSYYGEHINLISYAIT